MLAAGFGLSSLALAQRASAAVELDDARAGVEREALAPPRRASRA